MNVSLIGTVQTEEYLKGIKKTDRSQITSGSNNIVGSEESKSISVQENICGKIKVKNFMNLI